ncbi:uncharacterized protein LOC123563859 isoform X2 [Mercenaria mercenaria]|uniref:uncharacterized protein LOC123563859 isoform X2 n=1 Tax=Mercenaria mercenaria TaxID=6596 RepID=UPI00234FA4A4|nr:uncharacterized protein LOC123563859 isoform X2 [Mercenaria mercenaria]
MAEGGDHHSIQDGSDAYVAFTCTPCSEEGTSEEAVKYCLECDEYLCTTCTKYHRKVKTSRDHKLVDREEGKNKPKVATVTTKIKCRQHPDRDIEMYCGTHDMVYCLLCIATEHRTCKDVSSLTDAAGSSFHKNETDRLQEESESMKELLVDMEKTKQRHVVLLKEKKKHIQRRIQEIEVSMLEHIKTLSKQANATLGETYAKVKDELESDIAVVNRRRSEVEKVNEQLQSKTDNQEQRFVKVKLCQQIINDAKNIHATFESGGRVSVEFEESSNVKEQFLEVKSLGNIEQFRVDRKKEIQRQKEVNVKMLNDQDTCWIIDICKLDSGRFILADVYNKKVKLMDTDHNVINHFSVQGRPTGICKISHNEVAVKLGTNSIELLSVDTRISKLRSISVKQGGNYRGMAYTNGTFWVGKSPGVDVYDINGTFEKSVAKFEPSQMTVFQNSVYLTDNSDGIVCLKSDGTKRAEFRDSRLESTSGICISCDGTVYTVDHVSKKIVMFSQTRKCLGELLPSIPSGIIPESLCYDDKNNCILIGNQPSNTVTVLYLSD